MLPRTLEPEVMDTVDEAVDYDSMDHSTVNRLFVAELLDFADKASDSFVDAADTIDLGTGTALIPIELLRQRPEFGRIFACDLSQEMLKLAQRRLADEGLDRDILPVFCDCKRLPIADESCRLIMSNSIVHHIPNPADVFAEIRRTLAPGGILFVRDLMRPESSDAVETIVETYAGDENAHQQKMFRESLHAALTVEEVQGLLNDVDLPIESVFASSDRHWTIALQLQKASA